MLDLILEHLKTPRLRRELAPLGNQPPSAERCTHSFSQCWADVLAPLALTPGLNLDSVPDWTKNGLVMNKTDMPIHDICSQLYSFSQ